MSVPSAVTDLGVEASRMAELAAMTAEGAVNRSAAIPLAQAMLTRPDSPRKLAEELGLVQVRDTDATVRWVDEAFAAHEQAVRDALANPKRIQAATGFLRGQVMKLSGGKADPKLVSEWIERKLADLRGPQP